MDPRTTRADQHQSLSRERPLRPVPSSPVRSVSAWSPKPLLILSAGQTVVEELSQASCQQLALSSLSGALPFEDFSMVLEEVARGSFCGLVAIRPASTWSRARNSWIRGPLPLRCRQSLCHGLRCVVQKCLPSHPFFFVVREDRGGQLQHGPASIWQLAEKMAIVQRTREAVRGSAFACELRVSRFSTSARFHQQSLSPQLRPGSRLATVARHWPSPSQLFLWQASSRTSWHHCRWTVRSTEVSAVSDRILVHSVGSNKQGPWRWRFNFSKECDQECRDEVKAMLEYSSSPWFTRL